MNKPAFRLTVTLIRKLMPLVLRLLKDIEEAQALDSDGGKKITKEERWEIAHDAALDILPELVEGIQSAMD